MVLVSIISSLETEANLCIGTIAGVVISGREAKACLLVKLVNYKKKKLHQSLRIHICRF